MSKPQGKVEIKVGNVSFTGEGDQDWLSSEVDKILKSNTGAVQSARTLDEQAQPPNFDASKFETSLPAYIKDKKGESNQTQRFLSTAAWLSKRGEAELTSSLVAKTLSKFHQKRLANPADCLNKNVQKGYCEKTDSGFFILPDGWKALEDQIET